MLEADPGVPITRMPRRVAVESQVAERLVVDVLRGRFRYAPGLGWLEWLNGRWQNEPETEDRAREVTRLYLTQQVEELAGTERGDEQAELWKSMLTAQRITAVLQLARAMSGVLTAVRDLDAYPELLNVGNGVLNLRTGVMTRHNPDLLMTKMAGGDYDETAVSELWETVLMAVPEDLRDWFQLRIGQALTGYTPDDDSLVILVGTGENGKSGVMSAIMRAAGTYSKLVSHRVLLLQPGQHPTEMMDLRGLRLALMEETPEEGHLDTHQLKTVIGTPKITARLMRQDSVTFDTSHSLFVNTNFLPQVDTTDHGTWRRLAAMEFPFRFMKPGQEPIEDNEIEGDPTIKPRVLTDETLPAAVLAWAVEGAQRWFAQDRISGAPPERVQDATERWRAGSDVAYLFALECLEVEAGSFVPAKHMTDALAHFIESQGKRPWAARTMNIRLPPSIQAAGLGSGHKVTTMRVTATDDASLFVPDPFKLKFLTLDYPVGKVVKAWKGLRLKYEGNGS